jgi:hypothetical protein
VLGFKAGRHGFEPRDRASSIDNQDRGSAFEAIDQGAEVILRFGNAGSLHSARIVFLIELFKLAVAATASVPAPPDFQHGVPMPDYLRNRTPGAVYRTHPPLGKNLKRPGPLTCCRATHPADRCRLEHLALLAAAQIETLSCRSPKEARE